MPQPRTKLIVRPARPGGLVDFRSRLIAQLQQYPDWKSIVDGINVDYVGQHYVIEVEFASNSHATAFKQWFQANLTAIRTEVNGVAKAYLCSHDDAEVFSCKDDPRAQYQEVAI